jgi:small conductance mechanosensitive channel
VQGLADSAVLIAVRAFTGLANYFTLSWDINERAKLRFDQEGISIPYPQRDVHILAPNAAPAQTNKIDEHSEA